MLFFFFICLCVFNICCIYRDPGEKNFIDVDLKMARDVFKKLAEVPWISSLVTTIIYLAYLRYSIITLVLVGGRWPGPVNETKQGASLLYEGAIIQTL